MPDRVTAVIAVIYAVAIATMIGFLLRGGAALGWQWWTLYGAVIVALISGVMLWKRSTWRPVHWRCGVIGGVALVVVVTEAIPLLT
jgi:hypothetical protein